MKHILSVLLVILICPRPSLAAGDGPGLTQLMPQIEAVVADIDRFLLEVATLKSGPVIGANLIQIVRTYPFVDLLWLENRFRRLQTDIHLIGQPKQTLPAGVCATALWPFLPEPDFTLWIGVNGRQEMLEQLEVFGVPTEAQNRENLMRTGLMSLKSESAP